MDALLDFTRPLDVELLDRVSAVMLAATSSAAERAEAQRVLVAFKAHQDAWTRADVILESAKNPQSKYAAVARRALFLALGVLEDLVKTRWKIVPPQQRTGIKNYTVNMAIALSSDEHTLRSNKVLLRKLNYVLVQIIKQEWPKLWTSFIPEIVSASRTNEALCENNMEILSLLSSDVFEFGKQHMTRAKAAELKTSFTREFSDVFKLCEFVLDRSQKVPLINCTLNTLQGFLQWIPVGFVYETRLLETLVTKFFAVEAFRNSTLRCLAEVGAMPCPPNYESTLVRFFVALMEQLKRVVPNPQALPAMYEAGHGEVQHFVQHLALFFASTLRQHWVVLERAPESRALMVDAHGLLAALTLVEEREIFKVCLEYWGYLASNLYHDTVTVTNVSALSSGLLLLGSPLPQQQQQQQQPSGASQRRAQYAPVLSLVRLAVIQRMAKPEEVLIVEDENGEIIRERTKDTDQIVMYKVMRQTLVYLTHLDPVDTQRIMVDLLQKVCDGRSWSWHNVNTLSWAIGSISGAQSEEAEKRFLILVVKDLLTLTEIKQGKPNKAVIASDIMYVVGQYPRFLRAHWRFLRTVVMKLFEFMLELHPGVQDMAVDTFLKIAKSCRRKFVVVQVGETQPLINSIVEEVQTHIQLLDPQQTAVFYKALGVIISSCTEPEQQTHLIAVAMRHANQSWTEGMRRAAANVEELKSNPQMAKTLANILKINVALCAPVGKAFAPQLSGLYRDMLNVYSVYSEVISRTLEQMGPRATGVLQVRLLRRVKRAVLQLIITYVEVAQEAQHVPLLLNAVLVDYPRCIPEARDAEVLRLIATVCSKLDQLQIGQAVPSMFHAVFECTLQMLVNNFSDYPDHRRAFYEMVEALVTHQFATVLHIAQQSGAYFKLIVDSIVWGFKHTDRVVSESAVRSLLALWKHMETGPADVAAAFHAAFLLTLVQDILFVLTDTMHKSSFKSHAHVLMILYRSVITGQVRVPLGGPDTSVDNVTVLRQFTTRLLSQMPTLTPAEVNAFVAALTNPALSEPQFVAMLRDFLVALKEFSSQDNSDLFVDEREASAEQQRNLLLSVPGMFPPQPHEMLFEKDDDDLSD